MRPLVDGMFDSEVSIYRYTVEKDDLKVERRVYSLVASAQGAAINRSRTPTSPSAAGLAPTGIIRLYLRPDADVGHRDVIVVTSGPDSSVLSPRMWEVNELPVRPRNHHTQLDCIEWHGKLTEAEQS